MKFIAFEEIPTALDFPKFKEFYFSKDKNAWVDTATDTYYRINITKIETIIFHKGIDEHLVSVFGMTGKFFI